MTFTAPSFDAVSSKEWLVTNGIGGYASTSICGTNTRRYHGLLVASKNPPTQRRVLVSGIGECLSERRDTCIDISTNQYPGAIHPQGFKYVTAFNRDPFPRSVYQIGNQKIAKTIFMVYGSNTTIIEYENIGETSFQLGLTPFFVDRDYHSLFQQDARFNYYADQSNNTLKIYSQFGADPLYMKFSRGEFQEARHWFKNLQYEKEKYRGLEFQEDRYALGRVDHYLTPGQKLYLSFSTDAQIINENPEKLKKAEIKRLKSLKKKAVVDDQFFIDLLISGDQFVVKRKSNDSYTILAGYHWFTDWGRDTMIAMRGLTIAPGNKKASKSILKGFFAYVDQGMLPNRFPDNNADDIEYNTVDATLWFFIALYEYYEKFDDLKFIEDNFSALIGIIKSHIQGTRYRIKVTEEGFLSAGEEGAQLTWMDAKVGDHVATPRHGCPVEIQSLWYNALNIFLFFKDKIKRKEEEGFNKSVKGLVKKIKGNFKKYFWNEKGYLNDVINLDQSIDDSIRPNQIYAISLPFSLLNKKDEQQVFDTVQSELYTPFGLRTLDQNNPNFKSTYGGNQWSRDTAYHQGTVWPFLLGDYFMAQLKLNNFSVKVKSEIRAEMKTLEKHFYEDVCINGISEIFDGKDPSEGRGTIHQAWSVSGLLKVFIDGGLVADK